MQYNVARFEQQRKLAENETARSRTLSAQVSTFSQTETELRSQLNIYVEKFKQASLILFFHDTQNLGLNIHQRSCHYRYLIDRLFSP